MPVEEYYKTIAYMMIPGTVSAHRVIGVELGQYAQVAPDDKECWAAEEDNLLYLQIEFCQPTPDDPFSEWQYKTASAVIRAWARKYNFAPSDTTILAHEATDQGRRWGKSDPGKMFSWPKLWAMVGGQGNRGGIVV